MLRYSLLNITLWLFAVMAYGKGSELKVLQMAIERPGLFVRPTGVVHLQEDTSEGRNKYVERTKTY